MNIYTYVATAVVAASIGATGAWQVQGWRHDSAMAARDKADAAAKIRQAERRIEAQALAATDNQASGEQYAKLEREAQRLRSAQADIDQRHRAAVQRLLDASGCRPSGDGVQPTTPRGGADAVAPEWRIDRFIPRADAVR